MTSHKDLKTLIRERQNKTGESYTAARVHVMRTRAELLGLPDVPTPPESPRGIEAIVLKVGQQSVRVRIPTEDVQVTVRTSDTWDVVPGHVVTLVAKKRWNWLGHAYASGTLENPQIDVARLGLTPLPLHDFELADDLRGAHEPFERREPYFPLWQKLTAKPRPSYEMDSIAWCMFSDSNDPEEDPTSDAMDMAAAGDVLGARALLMDLLLRDLRCLDAHAHLGNLAFDIWPERAMAHCEFGVRIGELSLPPGFDGVLMWGRVHNRPFLRCLHGYGLCLWRLGRTWEAEQVFERVLSLNPPDNQGVRFCWDDVRSGRTWEEMSAREEAERVERRQLYNERGRGVQPPA